MGTNLDMKQNIQIEDVIDVIETQPEPALSAEVNIANPVIDLPDTTLEHALSPISEIDIDNEVTLNDTRTEPSLDTISDIDVGNEVRLNDTRTEPSLDTISDIDIDNEVTLNDTRTEPSLTTISDIDIENEIDMASNTSVLEILTGTEDYGVEHWVADRLDLAAQWGTGSEDRHFPNYSGLINGLSGSYGFSNVNYYDDREIFHMIGDTEEISGSMPASSNKVFFDFNNIKSFRYRNFITNKSAWNHTQYKSYVKTFGGDMEGLMKEGKVPIGKTAYYVTRSSGDANIAPSSVGDLLYPSNHWTQFPEDPTIQNFNNGTQYIGDRFLISRAWTDHSTASFYNYEVADEKILRVERGTRRSIK